MTAALPADETRLRRAAQLKRLRDMASDTGRYVVFNILPGIVGLALFVMLWSVVADRTGQLPGPLATWESAKVLFADPFYNNGPN
ncbi:MAG: nitrate ABC transporter, permease protein, partial [Gammaproteobacteria bacterium]